MKKLFADRSTCYWFILSTFSIQSFFKGKNSENAKSDHTHSPLPTPKVKKSKNPTTSKPKIWTWVQSQNWFCSTIVLQGVQKIEFPLLKDWRSHRLCSNWCSICFEAWINIWACKVWCKKVSIMGSLLPEKACGKNAHVLIVSNLVFWTWPVISSTVKTIYWCGNHSHLLQH